MRAFPMISLDSDWRGTILWSSDGGSVAESHHHFPRLSDWRYEGETSNHMDLQRQFYLEPTDDCVRYVLHIDDVPGKVDVLINESPGQVGSLAAGALQLDITDFVMLETNTIVLRVHLATLRLEGAFGAIYLRQVPCE
jgi:hypothetical protein